MGATPIYNWPTPDLPNSADGPGAMDALGRAIEATVNTNNTRRVSYNQVVNFGIPTGPTPLAGWPSVGGFVGTAFGVTVPEAGIYSITFACLNLSRFTVNPLTGLRIDSAFGLNTYFVPGAANCCVSAILPCPTAGAINTYFLNAETAGIATNLQLWIAKVSA